ncbi:MAG: Lrp/AsnC family transcriptional regulator [Nanoarchaeota archaeon]
MDEHEMVIIDRLKRDSRTSLADVSRELDVTTAQVMDTLEDLERQYLKGYTVVLDYPAMGYHCMALLLRTKGDVNKLIKHLAAHDIVVNVSALAGRYDVLCEVTFKQQALLDEFVKGLAKNHSVIDMELMPQLRLERREGHRL